MGASVFWFLGEHAARFQGIEFRFRKSQQRAEHLAVVRPSPASAAIGAYLSPAEAKRGARHEHRFRAEIDLGEDTTGLGPGFVLEVRQGFDGAEGNARGGQGCFEGATFL